MTKNNEERLYLRLEIEKHSSFNAEKQIELMKWLALNFDGFEINYDKNDCKWACRTYSYGSFYCKELLEAIFSLILLIWGDITTKQEKELRSILND